MSHHCWWPHRWLQWVAIAGLGFCIYGPQMLIGLCGAELVEKSSVGASQVGVGLGMRLYGVCPWGCAAIKLIATASSGGGKSDGNPSGACTHSHRVQANVVLHSLMEGTCWSHATIIRCLSCHAIVQHKNI